MCFALEKFLKEHRKKLSLQTFGTNQIWTDHIAHQPVNVGIVGDASSFVSIGDRPGRLCFMSYVSLYAALHGINLVTVLHPVHNFESKLTYRTPTKITWRDGKLPFSPVHSEWYGLTC